MKFYRNFTEEQKRQLKRKSKYVCGIAAIIIILLLIFKCGIRDDKQKKSKAQAPSEQKILEFSEDSKISEEDKGGEKISGREKTDEKGKSDEKKSGGRELSDKEKSGESRKGIEEKDDVNKNTAESKGVQSPHPLCCSKIVAMHAEAAEKSTKNE